MTAMLFGFGAESDDDDGIRSENVFGFVPRESFEKNGALCDWFAARRPKERAIERNTRR